MNKTILHKIENLKVLLIKSGMDKGLGHPNTLQLSEQLDIYIVKYQQLVEKNIKRSPFV